MDAFALAPIDCIFVVYCALINYNVYIYVVVILAVIQEYSGSVPGVNYS